MSRPFEGNSFSMLELLTLHGLEREIHNSVLTRHIAGELRAMGYTLRIFKYGRNWHRVWSNTYAGELEIKPTNSEKWLATAKSIVKRLPMGKKSLGGTTIAE